MRHKKSLHLLVIPLLILQITLFSIPTTKCSNDDDDDNGDDQGTSLIEETCKRTPHYDLCLSTLESKPESQEADLRGLAHMMIDTVLSKATETLDWIRALLKQEPSDPVVEKSLAYCAELYIPVVKYSLPQAIDALTGGHFGFANYGISDAAKQANACDKTISGLPENAGSSLSERNALLSDLSDVAAAMLSVLLKG